MWILRVYGPQIEYKVYHLAHPISTQDKNNIPTKQEKDFIKKCKKSKNIRVFLKKHAKLLKPLLVAVVCQILQEIFFLAIDF